MNAIKDECYYTLMSYYLVYTYVLIENNITEVSQMNLTIDNINKELCPKVKDSGYKETEKYELLKPINGFCT